MVSIGKLKALDAVWNLCAISDYKLASVPDLMRVLGKKRGAVSKELTSLKNEGLMYNPVHGGWKLTTKGEKTLLEILKK